MAKNLQSLRRIHHHSLGVLSVSTAECRSDPPQLASQSHRATERRALAPVAVSSRRQRRCREDLWTSRQIIFLGRGAAVSTLAPSKGTHGASLRLSRLYPRSRIPARLGDESNKATTQSPRDHCRRRWVGFTTNYGEEHQEAHSRGESFASISNFTLDFAQSG